MFSVFGLFCWVLGPLFWSIWWCIRLCLGSGHFMRCWQCFFFFVEAGTDFGRGSGVRQSVCLRVIPNLLTGLGRAWSLTYFGRSIFVSFRTFPMHLAVAGNIGSGKTTLTTLLAKHYRYTPHFEEVDNNPYLNDFYKDMTRWSFNLQVYFLRSRFSQLIEMKKKGKPIIQDRTIYEDANIFAPNLQAMGLMTTRDFENYLSLFELMEEFVTPPDLLV